MDGEHVAHTDSKQDASVNGFNTSCFFQQSQSGVAHRRMYVSKPSIVECMCDFIHGRAALTHSITFALAQNLQNSAEICGTHAFGYVRTDT